jgi:FkbM family methyltransferase
MLPLKRHLFSVLRPLPLPRWLYQHLHFAGPFSLDVDGRSITVMHYGYEVENELFWRGLAGWEPTSLRVWAALARGAQSIFDIGANTGIYSLVAKAVNPAAQVYSFEPVRRIYDRLVTNCRLNGFDVTCECMAVSSVDGPVVLYDLPLDHAMSASLEAGLPRPGLTAVPTTVEGVKLATYVRQRGLQDIDLMKIDVEMHEESVLRGMEGYLGRCRPPMVIEILTDAVAKAVESLIEGIGYERFYLDNRHGPVRVEELRAHHWLNTNFLLCTSGTLERAGGLAGLIAAPSR